MALRDNSHVKRIRTTIRVELPDPNPKWIFVVETDLPLTPSDPGYDAAAVTALTEAVVDEANRVNIDRAENRPYLRRRDCLEDHSQRARLGLPIKRMKSRSASLV